jgi:hypothetical protein
MPQLKHYSIFTDTALNSAKDSHAISTPQQLPVVGLTGRKEELLPWLSASSHSPSFVTIVAAKCYQAQGRRAPFLASACVFLPAA